MRPPPRVRGQRAFLHPSGWIREKIPPLCAAVRCAALRPIENYGFCVTLQPLPIAPTAAQGKSMPLNKACIGKQYPPLRSVVTAEAVQKFARAYNHSNPFFFDPGKAGAIIAPPMFGVTWVVPSTER